MGQGAHLICDHGKTSAGITSTGRFNRRVERQQVGLFGNGANYVEHLADVAHLASQQLHLTSRGRHIAGQVTDRVYGLAHLLAAMLSGLISFLGRLRSAHRIARHLFHRRGHFVNRRSSLFDLIVLLVQAPGGILSHRMQLLRGRGQLVGRVGNTLNSGAQALLHRAQSSQQLCGFVFTDDLETLRKVAGCHYSRHLNRLSQRTNDTARQHQRQKDGRYQRHNNQRDDHTQRVVIYGATQLNCIARALLVEMSQVDKNLGQLGSMLIQLATGDSNRRINIILG